MVRWFWSPCVGTYDVREAREHAQQGRQRGYEASHVVKLANSYFQKRSQDVHSLKERIYAVS